VDRISQFFSFNSGLAVVDHLLFHLDSSHCFRDIRGQSRKLSEIEPNLEQCLPSQILKGWCPLKVVLGLSPSHSGTSRSKVSLGNTP